MSGLEKKAPVYVHVDLDEGRYASISCLTCKETGATLVVATPFRFYDVALDCNECGNQIVIFGEFSDIRREQ